MFHPLRVARIERTVGPGGAGDTVALTLAVPPELRPVFRFLPGQHLTIRHITPDGTELRRNYSLCNPAPPPGSAEPGPAELTIGIRRIAEGGFSSYAVTRLTEGDTLEVMPPAGRFTLVPRPGRFAAVTGGSGITPVLSMAASLLAAEPTARFTLLRSDRTAASAMFLTETADLKDRYPGRFQLISALTREDRQAGLAGGRLDAGRLAGLLPRLLPVGEVTGWYLCGPLGLISAARQALAKLDVPGERVHAELFHAEDAPLPPAAPVPGRELARDAEVSATLDGRSGSFPVRDGETLLDAVLRGRPDAPYACKGGVCGTCRARLLSGEVHMDRNYALEPAELDAGYVLACQSHPLTAEVRLDFDA
ncbi:2Fe-2S iron-sulfur cluster-binding protein [Streptomyces aidingensis]|uniref:Ring-1,2-phenylacetyl-CoA epoxidase subunit PaaE n=1 Tax=Streptomyces aidingensis TaxID=910347 RepID=A0A1I1QNZ0_9ACTN|nr:2Fe-2S iron-sulfur cluster-binding protein [Streptomyces aidingensis]SFD23834.1 ring-1,2-phenylacetyl-CoA epoxidase subunit PaaE [Streptomyces aidingensis]